MTEEFDFDTFGDAEDVQEVKETEVEFDLESVESVVQANVDSKMNPSELRKIILSETGITDKALTELYEEKREALKGLISEQGALYLIAREHGIPDKDDKPTTPEETLIIVPSKEPEPVQTLELEPEPEMELVLEPAPPLEVEATVVNEKPTTNALALNTTMDLTTMNHPLTFEQKKIKVQQDKELLEFMAKTALNKDDFWTPPASRGKKALTRSGCNKLATVFNISTRTLKIWIVKEVNIKGEEDIIAYATVRAEKLNGVFVEITANKPLSDYESDKPGAKPPREWVDMQTLKGTAETRARNRAIQNIIGFVPKDYIVATKEEFKGG